MAKVILIFLSFILVFLPFADIEISHHSFEELRRFILGLTNPNFTSVSKIQTAILNTFAISFFATVLSSLLGVVLRQLWQFSIVRTIGAYTRVVHELFWVLILIPFFGLTPFCAVVAIIIPYSSMCAKIIYDLEKDLKLDEQINFNQNSLSSFLFFVAPKIKEPFFHFFKYRFECALRVSAIMGFIGIPTIGFYLETSFAEGLYGEAWLLIFIFLGLCFLAKYVFHKNVFLLALALSVFYVFREFYFSLNGFSSFWQNALIPWPVKAYFAGHEDFVSVFSIFVWFKNFFSFKILPGVWTTLVLTQVSLGFCFFWSIFATPFYSKKIGFKVQKINQFVLLVRRNFPVYILATIFLFLFGPSMLPAIIALVIHNSAIITGLTAEELDRESAVSGIKGKWNEYFYYFFPQSIKKLTIYCCFRWEFFIREASILGFLGIKTLGFYADSAFHENKYDDLLLILFFMANLNLLVSKIGQKIQERGLS